MIKKLSKNPKEIDNIMKIWKEATIKAHGFIPEEYWLKNYDTVKEKYIPMAETYVYIEENKINGFISILDKEYIGGLFVDTKSQGKGIGRELVNHIKSIYDNLTLAVYKENEKAVNFYKKLRFIIKAEQLNAETNHREYIMIFNKNKNKIN